VIGFRPVRIAPAGRGAAADLAGRLADAEPNAAARERILRGQEIAENEAITFTLIDGVLVANVKRYRVELRPNGEARYCSCPDWEYRGERVGPCKHQSGAAQRLMLLVGQVA